MSSKELFNTDKENIPNNILPIIEEAVVPAPATAVVRVPKAMLDKKLKPKEPKVTKYHLKKKFSMIVFEETHQREFFTNVDSEISTNL
jgi:hypothetical protein